MFQKLLKLFKSKDEKELAVAANEFDELMQRVDEDEVVLEKLEKHVREEVAKIREDVKRVSKGVDDIVGKEAA